MGVTPAILTLVKFGTITEIVHTNRLTVTTHARTWVRKEVVCNLLTVIHSPSSLLWLCVLCIRDGSSSEVSPLRLCLC